jgi:genome maintenance exonuclease 1
MFTHIQHDIPKLDKTTLPDGTRTYSTPEGKSYPSVTTVTGLLKRKQIFEWRKRVGEEEANRISAAASTRGTKIHKLCENYLSNEPVEPNLLQRTMFRAIKKELDNIDNIRCLETTLWSDHLQVAGTVDCIADYYGKISVIDFKTSSRIKRAEDIKDYFMQCASYAVAFEERTKIPVSRLVILMAVDEEEDPLVFIENRDDWIKGFIDLREQYRSLKNI